MKARIFTVLLSLLLLFGMAIEASEKNGKIDIKKWKASPHADNPLFLNYLAFLATDTPSSEYISVAKQLAMYAEAQQLKDSGQKVQALSELLVWQAVNKSPLMIDNVPLVVQIQKDILVIISTMKVHYTLVSNRVAMRLEHNNKTLFGFPICLDDSQSYIHDGSNIFVIPPFHLKEKNYLDFSLSGELFIYPKGYSLEQQKAAGHWLNMLKSRHSAPRHFFINCWARIKKDNNLTVDARLSSQICHLVQKNDLTLARTNASSQLVITAYIELDYTRKKLIYTMQSSGRLVFKLVGHESLTINYAANDYHKLTRAENQDILRAEKLSKQKMLDIMKTEINKYLEDLNARMQVEGAL